MIAPSPPAPAATDPRPSTPVWRLLRQRTLRSADRFRGRRSVPPAAAGLPTVGGLPASCQALLGAVPGQRLLAVLDGQLVRVLYRPPATDEPWAEVDGRRLAAQPAGTLGESLAASLLEHAHQVELWALRRRPGASGSGYLPRRRSRLDRETQDAIARFVAQTLVPRLAAEADGTTPAVVDPGRPWPDPDWIVTGVESFLQHWPRRCAFSGTSCLDLVPYWGPPRPGQVHLRYGDRSYLGLPHGRTATFIAAQDRLLETAVFDALGPMPNTPTGLSPVYTDPLYSVLAAPGGYYWCCRQLPAYALEDANGELYRYPPVQLGVCLDSLWPSQVLRSGSVVVMHPYHHVFLHGTAAGNPVCMPRPSEYYQELIALPLEEGLLRHLESARMTLCSGYHLGGGVASALVTREEARAASLPIYQAYPRPLADLRPLGLGDRIDRNPEGDR